MSKLSISKAEVVSPVLLCWLGRYLPLTLTNYVWLDILAWNVMKWVKWFPMVARPNEAGCCCHDLRDLWCILVILCKNIKEFHTLYIYIYIYISSEYADRLKNKQYFCSIKYIFLLLFINIWVSSHGKISCVKPVLAF